MAEPRVPLFPVALFLSALFAVLFEVFFPTPGTFADKLKEWQTLLAATVATFAALFAAYIAYTNTTATLKQSEYAERSARGLCALLSNYDKNGQLPHGTIPESLVQPLPSETLEAFTDFIEYSDPPLDVWIIETTISLIQIHNSRLRQLVRDNHDPSPTRIQIVPRTVIEARIIDAASIYAGVAAVYSYARQQRGQLPVSLSWDEVRGH